MGIRLRPFPASSVPTIRESVRRDLLTFARRVCGFSDLTEEFHGPLCQMVTTTTMPDGRAALNKLVLAPRSTYKSSVTTIAYPLWCIGGDQTERVIIGSDLRANSKKMVVLMRWHLEANPRYLQLYGHLKREPGWTDEFLTVQRDMEFVEPTLQSAGMDVVLTMLHFTRAILDDLVNESNTSTKDQLERTAQYVKDLAPIIEDRPKILVGTRWDDGDEYGRVMREASGGEPMSRTVERLRDEEASGFPYSQIGDWLIFFRQPYRALKSYGKITDGPPVIRKFTAEYLARQRREMGGYRYAANMLNDPVPAEHATFKRPWIERRWKHGDFRPEEQVTTMTIDPAIGESRDAAYSAVTSVGMDRFARRRYTLQAWHDRVGDLALVKRVFDMYEALRDLGYFVRAVGLEEYAMQRIYRTLIHEEEDRRGYTIPLRSLGKEEGRRGKSARIESLVPFFEEGSWLLGDGQDDLVEEMIRYPKSAWKDLLDSLAWHPILQRGLEGLIFEMFDPDRHVITVPTPRPRYDKVAAGLFRGAIDDDWAAVVAGRVERTWTALEEVNIPRGTSFADIKGILYTLRTQYRIPPGLFMLPASALEMRDEFNRGKFPVRFARAYSDLSVPLQRLNTLFERGRLYISSLCPNLIQQIGTLAWPDKRMAGSRLPDMRGGRFVGALIQVIWTEEPPEQTRMPRTDQQRLDAEFAAAEAAMQAGPARRTVPTGYGYR